MSLAIAGGRVAPHEQRDADDSFISDDSDLRRFAILHYVEERDNRGSRKVDMAQNAARFIEHLSQRHLHVLQLAASAVAGPQATQQATGCALDRSKRQSLRSLVSNSVARLGTQLFNLFELLL